MAIRMGLPPEVVYEVITHSAGNSWMFENRVPHILKGDYSPLSAVDIFVKDLNIVHDTGRELAMPTPVAAIARRTDGEHNVAQPSARQRYAQ